MKSKELKKINNSNKKEARKRCPKSGKSENENRKEKEALSMGQGVGKGGVEAWEEGGGMWDDKGKQNVPREMILGRPFIKLLLFSCAGVVKN